MEMLAMVVLSHRHNKEETISKKEKDFDFSIVRDTMYKYSKKAQERFFRVPTLAFLFVTFASDCRKFIGQKFGCKGADYVEKMRQEVEVLRLEACECMRKMRTERVAKELYSLVQGSARK
jgi:hypothetical protein